MICCHHDISSVQNNYSTRTRNLARARVPDNYFEYTRLDVFL